jgi:hypothetical protein
MAYNGFSGNSEGSVWRGLDGKAYQVINGRDVEVSPERLIIQGDGIKKEGVMGAPLHLQDPNFWAKKSQQNNQNTDSSTALIVAAAVVGLILIFKK